MSESKKRLDGSNWPTSEAGHDGVAQPSERITCTRCGSTDKGVRLALSTYPLIICSDLWHGVAQPESLSVQRRLARQRVGESAQPSPQPRCDHDPYDICNNCAGGESEQGGNVSGGIYEGPNGEELHGDGREVASPSAALSAREFNENHYRIHIDASEAAWAYPFAEAYAAHSGPQEPDWHAFYTDSETRRFAAEEKVVSLTQERDNWKMKCEQLQFAVKHYSGPTTEGVGMQAKPSAAKSERTK